MTVSPTPISKDAAAEALAEIDGATTHIRELKGYETGAPYLILWGIVWVVGGSLNYLFPKSAAAIWNVATAIGFVATLWMILSSKMPHTDATTAKRRRAIALKVIGTVATMLAFAWITMWLIEPQARQYSLTFFGLLTAAVYVLMGIWMGLRYALAGIAVALAMIVGKLFFADMFSLWFAIFCGGSLILCGFWLRRA